MKIPGWIPLIGSKKESVTAMIVFPNRRVLKKRVEGNVNTFTVSDGKIKRKYAVDPKAIYLFKGEPILFYNSQTASPLSLGVQDLELTMSSSEFQGIIESKVVPELLEASKGGGWDLHFIASVIGAITGILILMNSGGLSFLTGGA